MEKQIIYTSKAPEPIGPYSQAVKAGNLLFVSGQIAIDRESGEIAKGDIKTETRQVMRNMEEILRGANMTFMNIVKCSIFVRDMNNFAAVNAEYGRFFEENPPARETVEVSRLPKDANVEISCIAVGT